MDSATIELSSSVCYWCGEPATSMEHVPPKNLFPNNYRNELIKVPSCDKHNTEKSLVDERFRLYLQAMESNALALQAFKDKTVRGLERKESEGFRKDILANTKTIDIDGSKRILMRIKPEDQDFYFEAIIRGLYFYETKKTSKPYRAASFSERFYNSEMPYSEMRAQVEPHIKAEYAKDGICKNPEVFHYRFAIDPSQSGFLVLMTFYEGIEVIGMLTKEQF